MKKFYSLLLTITLAVSLFSQTASVKVNGTDNTNIGVVANGSVITITYNAANDNYSTFQPVNNVISLFTWINAMDTSTGLSYTDYTGSWPDTPSVQLNYDSTSNTYIGSIDLRTHLYPNSGATAPANSSLPTGTTMYKFNFLFRNSSGSSQSQDITAAFNQWVTLAVTDINKSRKSVVLSGQLLTAKKGTVNLTVYDFSGKVVRTLKASANGTPIDLGLSQRGLYLVKVSDETSTEVVKFAK